MSMQRDYTYSPINYLKRPKYLPFRSGTWKFEVGLHLIDIEDWLDIDENYESDIKEKQELREKFGSRIFQELPESLPAQEEIFNLILDLRAINPAYNLILNRSQYLDSGKALLDISSRFIQEDVCIMSRQERGWILTAAAVYFPSFWNLYHKMGRPMSLIHDPVPRWNDRIDDVIAIRMDNMSVAVPFQRFNWTLTTEVKRFQPDSERAYHNITPDEVGDKIFMRVERQVLYKLPVSNDIVFTIRTYMHPLSFLKKDESLREPFVTALLDCEEAILVHKGISMHKDSILEFLD